MAEQWTAAEYRRYISTGETPERSQTDAPVTAAPVVPA
jgi:hypothetical protein